MKNTQTVFINKQREPILIRAFQLKLFTKIANKQKKTKIIMEKKSCSLTLKISLKKHYQKELKNSRKP